jgi:uncharacterized protein YegP (UPF0339 family)
MAKTRKKPDSLAEIGAFMFTLLIVTTIIVLVAAVTLTAVGCGPSQTSSPFKIPDIRPNVCDACLSQIAKGAPYEKCDCEPCKLKDICCCKHVDRCPCVTSVRKQAMDPSSWRLRFVKYVDAAGQYRFRIIGRNGEKIGDHYHNEADCDHAIQLLKTHVASAEIWKDGVRES